MVKTDSGLYIDGTLKNNLDQYSKYIRSGDNDGMIIIDGRERAGKSTFAVQVGSYLDPNLTAKNLCYTLDDFIEAVRSSKRYQVIIYDEGQRDMNSRALEKRQQQIVSIFHEYGFKNIICIIVLPYIFELKKYLAISRSDFLLHVYKKKSKKGYFAAYNYRQKKRLYILGHKFMEYIIKPNFTGRFTSYFPIDKVEYNKKKAMSFNNSVKTTAELAAERRKAYNDKQRDYMRKYRGTPTKKRRKKDEPKPEEPVKIPGLTLPAPSI